MTNPADRRRRRSTPLRAAGLWALSPILFAPAVACASASAGGALETETDPESLYRGPCAVDSDCAAVPAEGCCSQGLVAVSRERAGEYQAAFACADPHPVCPELVVVDRRVARCDGATRRCELVADDR